MDCKKYILSLCLLLLSSGLMAEVVVLQSGKSVRGEIVLQNTDVVIIRTSNGMRYQYPMSEISVIKQDVNENAVEEKQGTQQSQKRVVAVRAQGEGGMVYAPYIGWGAHIGADLKLGANVLEDKRMFVGGEIGYRALILNDKTYSFIPLQACFSAILSGERHAPTVGLSLGYGFSATRNTQGGICAGVNVGWYYMIDSDTSIDLGLGAEWQQSQTDIKQTIENPNTTEQNDYINHMGVNMLSLVARLAIHF